MKAKYFKDEEAFYERFSKEKQAAIKAYWANKNSTQLQNATEGYLHLEYMSEDEIASYDAEMATSLLDVAASFLEDRKPMPYHLANYIATAFRETVSTTENETNSLGVAQSKTLGGMLNLKTGHRHPKTTPNIVGNEMLRLMTQEAQKLNILSETAALKQVGKQLGIAETTTKDHWYKWQHTNRKTYEMLCKILKNWKLKT